MCFSVWPRRAARCLAPVVLLYLPLFAESLPDLLTLALSRNGELQALRKRSDEVRGQIRQARLRPNPNLDVSYSNGPVFGSEGETDINIGLSQSIERGGKRLRRVSLAEAELHEVEWQIADRERQLRASIAAAFAEWLAVSRNEATARRLLDLTRQSLDLVIARVAQGEVAALEQSLLQVELNRIQTDLILYTGQRQRALLRLRNICGIPDSEAPQLKGDLLQLAAALPPADKAHEEIAVALRTRPDLAAMRAAEVSGDRAVELEKSAAVPNITAFTRYSHQHQSSDGFGYSAARPIGPLSRVTDRDNILTGGVSVALPFKNRNQGNIEAAVARKDAVRLRRSYLEQSIEREVSSALLRVAAAEEAYRLFNEGVVTLAERNLSVIRKSYELGEIRLLDVINEQRRLIEIQRTYTDALKERILAHIELDSARGKARQ